jgi:hypothetical protein
MICASCKIKGANNGKKGIVVTHINFKFYVGNYFQLGCHSTIPAF